MFDEPDESPAERPIDPADQARDKSDEFRMHAEIAAIFEGPKKFAAQLLPGLDPELARDIQKTIGRLEKSKSAASPILPEPSATEAAALLNLPTTRTLSTNDYHIHRRPGELMIVRWLAGDQVESFYERLQAHFDAALDGYKEEERSAQEWKQDPKTLAYLAALDAIDIKMADRYLRDPIRKHNIFVLSTQAADEISISYLCDYVMGVSAPDLVGESSAPADDPTEQAQTWFFKLFSLRGTSEGMEQMCFFTYLQKTEDSAW
jgi:hypothetical protein